MQDFRRSVLILGALTVSVAVSAKVTAAQGIVRLERETIAEFGILVSDFERVLDQRVEGERNFLWTDDVPGRRAALRKGDVLIEGMRDTPGISGGMLHVWLGAIFIPDATAPEVLKVLQDYDRHQDWYPEVTRSKLLGSDGGVFRGFLQLRKTKILTVVLDTEHEARYRQISEHRWVGRSYSTRIAEVEDPDGANSRELPVGEDRGFLWRMNAYWRLEEAEGGVFAESVSVSLSRGIPTGLGWLIRPFVTSMPRQSLEGVLRATRLAVMEQAEDE